MAVTKIKRIHTTLNKSIAYITNKNKTEDKILIDSFACSPETAWMEFEMTAGAKNDNDFFDPSKKKSLKNDVIAYHIIQSFAPDETTSETAHEIGINLADSFTKSKYEYVIATHIDKKHIHNHIIMNSVSFVDHKKYHSGRQPYKELRSISDRLCKEYGLSVVTEPAKKGLSYNKWLENKTNHKFYKITRIRAAFICQDLGEYISSPGLEKYQTKQNIKKLNVAYLYMSKNCLNSMDDFDEHMHKMQDDIKAKRKQIHKLELSKKQLTYLTPTELADIENQIDSGYRDYAEAQKMLQKAVHVQTTLRQCIEELYFPSKVRNER